MSGALSGAGVVSPGLTAPPGGDGVGSGDGAGGGDGGAGSSFFLQPAKRVTADKDTTFFIVNSPPFSNEILSTRRFTIQALVP